MVRRGLGGVACDGLMGVDSKEEGEGEAVRGWCEEDDGKRKDCRSEREESEGGPINLARPPK